MKGLLILVAMMAVALCGCTRQVYVPVESVAVRTDTLRLTELRRDSVYIHDSIAVELRGDTVVRTVWRDRYRLRQRTDTVYRSVVVRDSVAVPYPVERTLTRWEQTKQDAGGMAIGALLVAVCVAVIWLIKKFRK